MYVCVLRWLVCCLQLLGGANHPELVGIDTQLGTLLASGPAKKPDLATRFFLLAYVRTDPRSLAVLVGQLASSLGVDICLGGVGWVGGAGGL